MRNQFVNMSVIAIAFLISVIIYPRLGSTIPIHWTGNEQDFTSSKLFGAFFMPVFMLAIYYLISFLFDIDSLKKNVSGRVKNMTITSVLLSLLTIHIAILTVGLGFNLNMTMVCGFILGAVTMIISNIVPKVERNRVFGLRTKWTIEDDRVWKISNRFISKWAFLSGFLIIVSVMVAPEQSMYFAIVLLLLIGIVGFIHSYITYRKLND
ncbi:SdpI family protein [Bacillus sp. AGMB 02131]|uniref:SdpI family protein n=1 Tax=Peribacillus faecalis TaxID=2772559 RepID=A0A927HBS4_9BACI|nr:SdpI family protein [Peribacillus faecalis]MBD3108816.1 SdpI family protein [Peribacillus faecalis]